MWYQLHINNISKNSEIVQIIVTKNRTIPISRINRFLKVVLLPVLQGTKRKPRWQILEKKAKFELRICMCCHCCLRLVGFILNYVQLTPATKPVDHATFICHYFFFPFLHCFFVFWREFRPGSLANVYRFQTRSKKQGQNKSGQNNVMRSCVELSAWL